MKEVCFFQFTVGFSLGKKRLAATSPGRVPGACPPCVRFGRASKPCPACVCQVSHFLVFALAVPPNLVRHPSKPRRPCVRLTLYLPCVSFGRASKRCVSHVVALCVRSLSFLCPLVVRSLFALDPLLVGFCPGLWFGFGRAFVSSVSALWFLRLPVLSVVVRLSRGLGGCAFARCWSGHL